MPATQAQLEHVFTTESKRKTGVSMWAHALFRHRFALIGLIVLVLMTILAIFAPLIAPKDPIEINAIDRLIPMGDSEHLLGTDKLGRDVLSRLIFGARISLGVGFATVVLANLVGIPIGVTSGYYRRLDNVLMRIMDSFMAFPGILLALGIVAALGSSLANVVIALSIVYAPRVARIVRSSVLSIREFDYVEAARSIGSGDLRIINKHVLPNSLGPIIVQSTFIFAYAIISEASLSFLGVGVSPEIPSWGNMLNSAHQFIRRAPSLVILPGVAIMITVLALNLLGDGLRDILDPRVRDTRGAE